jgi:hypothetical protein
MRCDQSASGLHARRRQTATMQCSETDVGSLSLFAFRCLTFWKCCVTVASSRNAVGASALSVSNSVAFDAAAKLSSSRSDDQHSHPTTSLWHAAAAAAAASATRSYLVLTRLGTARSRQPSDSSLLLVVDITNQSSRSARSSSGCLRSARRRH